MQVEVRQNLALLPSSYAPQLRAVFPKVVERAGYAIVPHDVEHSMVLRNLGFTLPAPIESQYNWPGRYKPFDHQRKTAGFLSMNQRAFCLNDMGTGKTLASYWAADYLMKRNVIRRALIVAPLSTLEHVHADTIATNFMGRDRRSFAVLHGTPKQRRDLLAQDHDFYIINFDGIRTVSRELAARDDIDLVIVDELGYYRNAGTNRWKDLKAHLKPEMWVWGLTGMPTPNEPTDAWAEVKLVNPANIKTLYPSFRSFKFATMEQYSMYVWKAKASATDTVAKILSPSIRFERDDCLDLPPTTYLTLDVEMTEQQQKIYKTLKKDMMAEANGKEVKALNEAVLRSKLLQVSAGVVYDSDAGHQWIDCGPRINVLKSVLDEQPYKTIIFAPFKGNVTFLIESLKDYKIAYVTGDTSFTARNEIFRQFQSEGGPRVLVAHPMCMSHGLTLTKAATVVWFAPMDNNEIYEQANARITRSGQQHNTTIIHLASSAVEREVYRRNETKQKMQGLLLDILKTT
jgi:SNF2 family DNA or RNA helicase